MSKQSIIFVVSILFAHAIGLGIGIQIGSGKNIPNQNIKSGNDTYQAGWNAAKARLNQSPIGMAIPAGMEIKNISGTIQKIDGNKLTVKINPLEPLADPDLDTRIITADASTKINLAVQRDQVQFQKEMQAFQDKMMKPQTQTDPTQVPDMSMPPMSFENKVISLTELKENQQVMITTNENIKDKKEFVATQIDAQEIVATTTPMPNTPESLPPVPTIQ